MDLDTFFTTFYCFVDDWYKKETTVLMKRNADPASQMSAGEILTVAIAGQWSAGAPWRS